MALIDFAHDELDRCGFFNKDSDYGGAVGEAVMALIRVFAAQKHSGTSASLVLSVFKDLARYEPLSPLSGADDEWIEVDPGLWQNRRCSRVFKEKDGIAYDIKGIVFRDTDGICYTNSSSRVMVTFPYKPETKIVDPPVLDQIRAAISND